MTITAFDLFGSGVDLIEFDLGDEAGWQTYTEPISLSQTTTVSFRAIDFVGNLEVGQSVTVTIDDLTAPVVTIESPIDGSAFVFDSAPTAAFTCTDPETGISSCIAEISADGGQTWEQLTVDGPDAADRYTGALPYSAPSDVGTYALRVTAVNGDGQTTSDTVTFSVVYGTCFLYDVDKEQPLTGAVAVKLQLCDSAGTNLSKASITVTATSLEFPDGTTTAVQPDDSGSSNSPNFDFRYDPRLKGYIFNLNEDPTTLYPNPAPDEYYYLLFTVEGQLFEYRAPFRLK